MNRYLLPLLLAITILNGGLKADLPTNYQLETDWHLDPASFKATVSQSQREVILSNGLIRRVFRTEPNAATVGLDNLMTGETLLRAVLPEGSVTINGTEYPIGGLGGQPNHAFLTPAWIDDLRADPASFQFRAISIGRPKPRLEWKQVRHHAPDAQWPPAGVYVRMDYELPDLTGVHVSVHYEMYDGIPAISKWLTVENATKQTLTVDRFTAEILATIEHDNQVETREGVPLENPTGLHVETDMAFGGFDYRNANRDSVHWRIDPLYATQVNYLQQQPCLMVVEPTYGPSQEIEPGQTFESFRVFELIHDSTDRERCGLALRKFYRTIAPWVTENPLMLHCKSADETVVRNAIDQAAETGFEMIILSFGSGFDAENDQPDYRLHWKQLNDYAQSKGIHLGSYSLYSSRDAGVGNNIIPPTGMTNAHGVCPAITSPWGQRYLKRLYTLFEETGFMAFENDGPYPGDVDTTARPPLQKGIDDSRWVHWRVWTAFFKHLRGRGVYLNLPDYYYLSGANKCGMGYREVNWSLPREQQRIHTRQNIYDGTWTKTPSMGWMFVPLVEYQGGGAAATIEPLEEHCEHYEIMLRSNLGLGVQACYRGPRLYDTEKTKAMVTGVVKWYKQHRDILESDLIHGHRADGRDIDWMLHVNPELTERALLSAYNPTDAAITKTIRVPLYYSGLRERATVSINGRLSSPIELDAHGRGTLTITVPAQGYVDAIFQ